VYFANFTNTQFVYMYILCIYFFRTFGSKYLTILRAHEYTSVAVRCIYCIKYLRDCLNACTNIRIHSSFVCGGQSFVDLFFKQSSLFVTLHFTRSRRASCSTPKQQQMLFFFCWENINISIDISIDTFP